MVSCDSAFAFEFKFKFIHYSQAKALCIKVVGGFIVYTVMLCTYTYTRVRDVLSHDRYDRPTAMTAQLEVYTPIYCIHGVVG